MRKNEPIETIHSCVLCATKMSSQEIFLKSSEWFLMTLLCLYQPLHWLTGRMSLKCRKWYPQFLSHTNIFVLFGKSKQGCCITTTASDIFWGTGKNRWNRLGGARSIGPGRVFLGFQKYVLTLTSKCSCVYGEVKRKQRSMKLIFFLSFLSGKI